MEESKAENRTEYNDAEELRVSMGCVAQFATESPGVWEQIGANWAVGDTLYTEAMNARAGVSQ